MLITTTIFFVIGLLFIILACLVREKQMLSIFHSYHVDKISEENKAAFCKMSSAGLLVIGLTFVISAMTVHFSKNLLGLLIALLGFIIGTVILFKAINKYNK